MAKTDTNDRRDRRPSRARILLGVVIALLVLLLAVLGVYFVRVLTPARQVQTEQADTNGLVWVRSLYGFGPSAEEQLASPTSVAIAPNGEIYATDPQMARIMVFSPDGSFSRLLHTGMGGIEKGKFTRPESIACAENGDVYIADSFAGKIIVFTGDGEYLREWIIPNPKDETPRGVYVKGNRVYVLTVGKLRIYDLQGKEVGVIGTRGRREGQIDAYQGVASDGKNIYIADALNRRVMSLDTKGKAVWTAPKDEKDAQGDNAPYDLPQDLCFDGNGRLVTIDAFKFELIVSDPKNGDVIGAYGTDGVADGAFMYPSSIDYDQNRDWFAVADTRNNRVQIVRLPGSGGGARSMVSRALSSPYRYCGIPLLLLIVVLVVAYITSRKMRRADNEDEYVEIEAEDSEVDSQET